MVGFPKGKQPFAQCACLPAARRGSQRNGGGASLSPFHLEQTPQVCQVPTQCRLKGAAVRGLHTVANQPERELSVNV